MPRASVVRARAMTRRRGRKWSPVYERFNLLTEVNPSTGSYFSASDLCANSINTSAGPTATVIKCGNFKVWFDMTTNLASTAPVHGRAFIMFVPQNVTVDANLPLAHPEWIMAWRSLDIAASNSLQAVSLQSKLKRNLNSGDRVIALLICDVNQVLTASFALSTVVSASFVCCNN